MAVDRSKFRTCSTTSFCRRHRHGRSKPAFKYQLDPASIQFHPINDNDNDKDKDNVSGTTTVVSDGTNKNEGTADATAVTGGGGVMNTLKKMLTGATTTGKTNDGGEENSNKTDPYIRGPAPFFTAKLSNAALITSTGSSEQLNLAIHLHEDGVARVRITEVYDEKHNGNEQKGQGQNQNQNKPFSNARWTSDELTLNHEEMKSASGVTAFDHTTQEGKELLDKLVSTLTNPVMNEDGNYIGFRYGKTATTTNDEKCDGSSLFLIQFNPFALHLWREECGNDSGSDSNSNQYGPPVVSMNTDNLMHFEIRRLKDGENGDNNNLSEKEKSHVVKDFDDDVDDEKDPHNGKEIVGYWEDGLAIYADGTREERKEDPNSSSIVQEKRRALAEEEADGFHFDTDGMWEEKFGDHLDTKPYGPMSVGADISFPASTHLFGLPEHASSTQLKGTTGNGAHYKEPYRLYNLDVFEYELDETMALYGEVPLIISQSKTSGTVGVFWFNPTETFVDVENPNDIDGTKTHWISESGIIDLFLLPGPDPKTIYQQYATLTGRMPLPSIWSLGYHQCRWNYRDEQDVYQVHNKFEELDYPYDVLWLDIEHTDGKRYFTWDKNLFPNPITMQEKLNSQGRKMVTIIDPHIKRDNNYYVHNKATKKGLYIKDKNGQKDYDGWCWPGSSSYLDFTSKAVRNWWAKQFKYDNYIGSTPSLFTWNDMNEPSVFNGPEVSMQKDLRNLDGVEHREWHNLYGMLFQKATALGLTRRNEGENVRPFVLSRSFFAGR